MQITEIEIRACTPGAVQGADVDAVDGASLRGATAPEVVVISMRTDEGITGVSFGSGGLDVRVTGWFELLYPMEDFAFGLAEPLDIRDGYAYSPTGPGLGAVYDWDAIDNATVELV
jgi:L-alanine-DL-glutamate epimerase-like enolase superfamily enzyme